MKTWVLCLAATLILGAGLRLYRLDHSLRVDEAQAWAHAQQPLSMILSEEDRQPHAAVLSRLSCILLGDDEALFRLPYTLYGILSLPLIFLLGRRLFDEQVGVWACLLLALSLAHIQHSQEARYYAPLTFYALASLCCMGAALDPATTGIRRWLCWAGFGLAHLLALSLHLFAVYPAVLCTGFLLAAALIAARRHGRSAGAGLAAAVLMGGAVFLAGNAIGLWRFTSMEMSPFPAPAGQGTLTLRESYLRWHYRPAGSSIAWELASSFSGGPLLGALFAVASAIGLLTTDGARFKRSLALSLWVLLPVASLFLVRSRTHFEFRYFCFLLPVWLLLAAAGLAGGIDALAARAGASAGTLRRGLSILLAVLLLALPAARLRAYYSLPKSRMREAFSHLAAHGRPGDAAVFFPAWNILWYGYYSLPPGLRLFHPASLYGGSPTYSPQVLVRTHERLWLAGTWIDDGMRRREFDAFKASVERFYAPEQEVVFPARDPNDDYRVWLFRRRPGAGSAAESGGGRRQSPAPDPFRQQPLRMVLNIPETAELMAAQRRVFFPMLGDLALWRSPASGGAAPYEAATFCRDGCIAAVWSGSGRMITRGGGSDFTPGDVLPLSEGPTRVSASPGSGEIVLVLQTRRGRTRPESALRRLRPGEQAGEELSKRTAWQWVTGIVLQGVVHLEGVESGFGADLRAGDIYRYKRRWPVRWSASNRTASDSLEIRLIEDREPHRPDVSVSPAAGKLGGLLAPKLLP